MLLAIITLISGMQCTTLYTDEMYQLFEENQSVIKTVDFYDSFTIDQKNDVKPFEYQGFTFYCN